MKNETERKRQTQDKGHNILNIVGKVIGIGLWASLIIVCVVNRDKITAEGIVGLVPQNSWLSAIILLMLFAVKSVSVVIYSGILYAASGIKMEHAKLLLKYSSLSVSDVAEAVGYSSIYYFSKYFKNHYNVSPTEYKKSAE